MPEYACGWRASNSRVSRPDQVGEGRGAEIADGGTGRSLQAVRKGRLASWGTLAVFVAMVAGIAAWSVSISPGIAASSGHVAISSSKLTSPTSATTQLPLANTGSAETATTSTTIGLESDGLGIVGFGATFSQVKSALSAYLGESTGEPDSGCGPEWTQIEWHDLVVEFHVGVFSGYRDILGGWPPTSNKTGRSPDPSVATSNGVGLGGTLGQLKSAYPDAYQSGSFTWTSPDGIHFVIESVNYPPSLDSPIAEIKIGTCGDF